MKNMVLCFLDKNERILLEKKLTALPLKEDAIIQKSIEFFNDPEPCMIHRSAVMKRIFMEFGEFFSKKLEEGNHELLWSEIPEKWKEIMDIGQGVEQIVIKKK